MKPETVTKCKNVTKAIKSGVAVTEALEKFKLSPNSYYQWKNNKSQSEGDSYVASSQVEHVTKPISDYRIGFKDGFETAISALREG